MGNSRYYITLGSFMDAVLSTT